MSSEPIEGEVEQSQLAKPGPQVSIRTYGNAHIIASLRRNAGILSRVAAELQVSYGSLKSRIQKSVELAAVQAEIDLLVLDLAESTIVKAMQAGDANTARWYLDRRGKGRGYGYAPHITVEGGVGAGGEKTVVVKFDGWANDV